MAIPALAPVDRPAEDAVDEELEVVPLAVVDDEAAEAPVAVESEDDSADVPEVPDGEVVSALEVAVAADEAWNWLVVSIETTRDPPLYHLRLS